MPTTPPLISIIIPVYNAAKFITSAYRSVIDQNINDIEILFVDNNSTDRSKELIHELRNEDARVLYYLEPIQGAAAARNKGIVQAKGRFIYMLDVDDQIFPDTLTILSSYLETHPSVDAIFGNMLKSGVGLDQLETTPSGNDTVALHEPPYWGLKWFSDLSSVVGPPAFLYRRSVFETIGMYPTELLSGEDTALDIKLGMLCRIAHIDRFVYLYLKHDNSTTDHFKKHTSRVFMQWPRLTRAHLEFYRQYDTPEEYQQILFRGIFVSMGKMIHLTKGISARKRLLSQLLEDLGGLYIPSNIRAMLTSMIYMNHTLIYKLYIRYIDSGFINMYISTLKRL